MPAAVAITPEQEGRQSPGDHEQWSDSTYLGGGDARSGLAFYTRVGRRPNEGHIEAAIGVWLPDGRFLLSFAREPDRADGPQGAGPVTHTCLLPLHTWTITLGYGGRLYARPEDIGERREDYETVPLAGELTFSGWVEPFAFAGGLTEQVAQRHYEQPGSVHGWISVGEERFPIAGAGLRDHSWGVRDWQGVPYWRWMGMLVDPDTFVLINNVGTADGGETVGGCLMREGTLAPVVGGHTTGDQRGFTAHATDELGREVELHGAARSIAPLRQRRDGRLTLVNEGLADLRWDGHEGIGLCEWLVQTDG